MFHGCKGTCSGWNDGFLYGEQSALQKHKSTEGKLEISIEALTLILKGEPDSYGDVARKALEEIKEIK